MKLLKILVVVAATGLMGSAQAQAVTDLGTLSPTIQEQSGFFASGGSFADIYNFTIGAEHQTLFTSAVSYSPTGTGIVSLNYSRIF